MPPLSVVPLLRVSTGVVLKGRDPVSHTTKPLPAADFFPAVTWCHRPLAVSPLLGAARIRPNVHTAATEGSKTAEPAYLSDIIAFESADAVEARLAKKKLDDKAADELINKAAAALESARRALEQQKQRSPARPSSLTFGASLSAEEEAEQHSQAGGAAAQEATRAVLERSLANARGSIDFSAEEDDTATLSGGSNSGLKENSPPTWAKNSFGSRDAADSGFDGFATRPIALQPKLQEATETKAQSDLDFAEPLFASFDLISQADLDVEKARQAELPPLQSVLEMTTAHLPPQRGGAPVTAQAQPSLATRAMADGAGQLADGTKYERTSGEERGANGFWLRWTQLQGVSAQGKVEWEEKWWEASDWAGMREMGAEKSGCKADGSAWRETWREAIVFDEANGEPKVERSAHKWAHDAKGDEWEEKWGEQYWSTGRANKWADKWGKDGPNVWHERWGEDYDTGSMGGGCTKYTDKWAERLHEDGTSDQWGEKWTEEFAEGKGGKKGETWSVNGYGERYQRWWGENHFGNGWVQKYGNSNTGEHWDVSEEMDTYYNPIPHFGYRLALNHSPQLLNVPTLPRGGDELGDGISAL
ncbi:hypothetical protein WJX72_010336 [[Myrmecia] bisecta]|uniref:Uncharacterized protein n=1 Tax=[Myrmecia] bisecta TaxID=41462 RepID=A0AAW1PIZ9_9CHLO